MNEYKTHIDNQSKALQLVNTIKKDDTVYFFQEYRIFKGYVLSVNQDGIEVDVPAQHSFPEIVKSVALSQAVREGTPTALVFEAWNGTGEYRWETSLYQDALKPIELIPHNVCLIEREFGYVNSVNLAIYMRQSNPKELELT